MLALALTSGARVAIGAVCAAGLWLLFSLATATYGANRGFRFWPLLVCSFLIGFPLVLLAVTIAAPILDRVALSTDNLASGED